MVAVVGLILRQDLGSSSGTGGLLIKGQGGSRTGVVSSTTMVGPGGSSFWGGGADGSVDSNGGAYGGGGSVGSTSGGGAGFQGVIVIEY
jgi:hypothetical protein